MTRSHEAVVIGGEAADPALTLLVPPSWLDYFIVASLLLIPQSLFAAYPTSLCSFAVQKVFLYSTPGVLLAMRAMRERQPIEKPILRRFLKYFIFVGYGLGLALFNTESPQGVINSYGAVFLFMGYAALYLSASTQGPLYHINLIRLLFVHIAMLGVVHWIAWGLLGIQRTLFDCYAYADGASVPFSGLTLVYSFPPLGAPRYGFLFMEPRVLGSQLPVALLLQYGYLRYVGRALRRPSRNWARLQFAAFFACMFITHSATGYTILAILAVFAAHLKIVGTSVKGLRTALFVGIGLPFWWGLFRLHSFFIKVLSPTI